MMNKIFKSFLYLLIFTLTVSAIIAEEGSQKQHKIIFQMTQNEPERMELLLNNVAALEEVYHQKGDDLVIEVIAYGPGLLMMMENSPVKDRIKSIAENFDNVTFLSGQRTIAAMEKKLNKKIKMLPQVKTISLPCAVHVIQRQEEGWIYIRP